MLKGDLFSLLPYNGVKRCITLSPKAVDSDSLKWDGLNLMSHELNRIGPGHHLDERHTKKTQVLSGSDVGQLPILYP